MSSSIISPSYKELTVLSFATQRRAKANYRRNTKQDGVDDDNVERPSQKAGSWHRTTSVPGWKVFWMAEKQISLYGSFDDGDELARNV